MDLSVFITNAIFKICCIALAINSLCNILVCSYSLTYNLRFALFFVVVFFFASHNRAQQALLEVSGATPVSHIAPQNSVTASMMSVVQATKIIIIIQIIIIVKITIATTIIPAGIRCSKKEIEKVEKYQDLKREIGRI